MKVLLVHPGGAVGGIGTSWNYTIPITLPYLAALTPPGVHVEICYMGLSSIERHFDIEYDLVGISVLTTYARVAFQIADRFRSRGTKVVMGGVHATIAPDAAMEHSDSVVVGEAEELWPRVVEDAARDDLKRFYKAGGFPSLSGLPSPRFDLVATGPKAKKIFYPVLTSKGCPNRCEYCFVPELFGGTLRVRPVEEVLRDVRSIVDRMKAKRITFVDDNVIGNRRHAKALFRGMMNWGVKWCGECTLDIADDPELLELAVRSGCVQLSVGLESINKDSLREAGKKCNIVEKYPMQIREIQRKKILLVANIMFGFDHDSKEVFPTTIASLIRWKVGLIAPFILRPIVGTRLYRRLEEEGRLLPEARSDHTRVDVVTFVPRRMGPEELEKGFHEAVIRFYSLPSIARRLLFPPSPLFFQVVLINLLVNLKIVQWPRLKRIPLLNKLLYPVKVLLKGALSS